MTTHNRRRQPARVPLQRRRRPPVGPQRPATWEEVLPYLSPIFPPDILEMIANLAFPERRARLIANALYERQYRERQNARRRARRARRANRVMLGFNRRMPQTQACQCHLNSAFVPCGESTVCPRTGRPVRMHYAPGVNDDLRQMALLEYEHCGGHPLSEGHYEVTASEYEPRSDSSGESSDSI